MQVFRFDRQEGRPDNRRLAKKRVQWLIEHSTSYQILCWVDSLVLRNPLLRKAGKRQPQPYQTNRLNSQGYYRTGGELAELLYLLQFLPRNKSGLPAENYKQAVTALIGLPLLNFIQKMNVIAGRQNLGLNQLIPLIINF